MQNSINPLRFIPLLMIKFYQKFLSPYKGFSCASNVLHKNGSCSGLIFSIIKTQPILKWKGLIKSQFTSCKHASITINKENEEKKRKDQNKDKDKDKKDNKNDCFDEVKAEGICCIGESSVNCLGKGLSKKLNCLPDCGDCADVGSCF
jgi:putative component of membrane protein insertase Oxa1/YidC/SpoIIIJ protein YidD